MFFASGITTRQANSKRRRRAEARDNLSRAARPCVDALESRTMLSFSPAATYPTGTGANAVTVADFNGDGKPDMAVANDASVGTVSVLLGNGDGTFRAGGTFAAGAFAVSVVSGDVNGDGHPDLLVASAVTSANAAGTFNVLLNNGDGTFGAPKAFAAVGAIRTIAVGHFNHDANLDVVTQGSLGVAVSLGNGDGTFAAPVAYAAGSGPNDVAVADLNHDGLDDLAVPDVTSQGTVSILLSNSDGSGTMQPGIIYAAYSAPYTIDIGDFNDDGNEDIVVPNSYASSAMTVLLGNGDGTYGAPHTYALPTTPFSIDVGDFNGDGVQDLAERGGNDYYVQLGKGDGTFYAPTISPAPSGPVAHSAVADFNGDGSADLAAPDSNGAVSVLLNTNNDRAAIGSAVAFGVVTSAPNTASQSPVNLTVTALDVNGAVATDFTGTVYFSTSDPLGRVFTASYAFTPADAGVHAFTGPVTLVTPGQQTVTVSSPFITGGVATVTVTALVSTFAVTAPATAAAGDTVPITVRAIDAFGNTGTNYTGTVTLRSSDAQAGLPASYTFTADDAGVHTFYVTLKTAGPSRSVTAFDTTGNVGSAFVTVTPGVAVGLTLNGGAGPVGTSRPVSVQAVDAFGNVATGYTGTLRFTTSDPDAVLPPDTTIGNGQAFVPLTLKTMGTQTLTATDGALTGTEAIVGTRAAASYFVVGRSTWALTAGGSETFAVAVIDSLGNVDSDYTGTVRFSSTDWQAGLPAAYTFTATDAGVHTFTATLKTAGPQQIVANDVASYSVAGSSAPTVVSPAAAARFSVVGFPGTVAGVAKNFTVSARDAFGNLVPTYVGTVKFTSTDAQATLPAAYTFTGADAGVHTFSATLKTSGSQSAGQTITATDASNATFTGSQLNIGVDPAAMAGFTISTPSNIAAGTAFSVKLVAVDAFGNGIKGYAGTVHFTVNVAGATVPADYTFSPLDGGVHSFTVTLNTAGAQTFGVNDLANASLKSTVSLNVGAKASGGGGGGGGSGGGGGGKTTTPTPVPPTPVPPTTPTPPTPPAPTGGGGGGGSGGGGKKVVA